MKTFKQLLDFHLETGYFSSRKGSPYQYVLSPYPFCVSQTMKEELSEIGQAVKDYLQGTISFMNECQNSNEHLYTNLRSTILSAMHGLPYMPAERSVPICKVDLMINREGSFRIAEIDGYNPRGIAFNSFVKDLHRDYTDKRFFLGVETTICEEMIKRNSRKLVWLYANHERFYVTAFLQLQRILHTRGIEMVLHNTDDSWHPSLLADNSVISMIPWGTRTPGELLNKTFLINLYQDEPDRFLYPLAPWLGTKALMGMVSNAGNHPGLETIGLNHFKDIERIRKYLPKTVLVGKKFAQTSKEFITSLDRYVLKAHVASGLKGVWFSDDQNSMCSKLDTFLSEKKPNYTVQEYVDQKTFQIETFSGPRNSLVTSEWYLRLTAHVNSRGEVIDGCITGRPTPDVHGAPDCIQAPCVY